MTLRNLFIITAAIGLLFGLVLTLAPATTYALYGLPLDEVGVYTTRFIGAAYLGFSVIVWFARDVADYGARRAVILGFFVMETGTFFVSLNGVLFGPANAPSWTTVLFTLLLALGFGISCSRSRPPPTGAASDGFYRGGEGEGRGNLSGARRKRHMKQVVVW